MLDTKHSRRVLLFSGKRKSGKDHLTEYLLDYLNKRDEHNKTKDQQCGQDSIVVLKGSDALIIRISGPLKRCYAENHGLDFETLLSADAYKEKHRLAMIKWSEEIR